MEATGTIVLENQHYGTNTTVGHTESMLVMAVMVAMVKNPDTKSQRPTAISWADINGAWNVGAAYALLEILGGARIIKIVLKIIAKQLNPTSLAPQVSLVLSTTPVSPIKQHHQSSLQQINLQILVKNYVLTLEQH